MEDTTANKPVRLKRGGVVWTVVPSFAQELPSLLADWENLSRDGATQVVKEGPARAVYRWERPGGALFVKEYRRPTWWDRFRFLFRPSTGKVEWEVSTRCAARGIPVPEPLAMGERRRFGALLSNFLVTAAIDGALPLSVIVSRASPRHRTDMLREMGPALARFIRSVHDAGVFHRDLHAGNILARRNAGAMDFFLTDLHDVSLSDRPGGLPALLRLRNLAVFNWFWSRWTTRTQRRRFLAAYEETDPVGLDPREIERASLAGRKAFWSSRERRCVRNNKYFETGRLDGRRYFLRRGWDRDALLTLMKTGVGAKLLKDGGTTRVEVHALDGPEGPAEIVVKRYKNKGPRWALSYLVRRSRALRGWRLANALFVRDVPTAMPVAAWEVRRLGLLRESGVVTQRIADARELHAFLTRVLPNLAGRDRLKAGACAAELLGRAVASLHERGFSHRDLKVSNILLSREDGEPRAVYLIDLDGISRCRRLSTGRRMLDLARLAVSARSTRAVRTTDGLRFLKAYLGLAAQSRPELERWWSLLSSAVRARRAS
ncbi:MAG: lipopolysaccharide kinase InaA family protein [Planctomycetota bacterium]